MRSFRDVILALVAFSAAVLVLPSCNPYGWQPAGYNASAIQPPRISEYQPSTNVLGTMGDYVFMITRMWSWVWNAYHMVADALGAVGVPPVWIDAITMVCGVMVFFYIMYLVAGRS